MSVAKEPPQTEAKRKFETFVTTIGKQLEAALPAEHAGRASAFITQKLDTVTLSGKGLLEILFAQQTLNIAVIDALLPVLDGRKQDAFIKIEALIQEVRGQSEAFAEVLSKALTEGLASYIDSDKEA